jgi:hypothetical protein
MSTLAFIAEFKALHDKAKKGTLTSLERTRYADARLQFSRLVVIAQQLGHSGQTLRSDLRMAKMLKVEVRPDAGEPLRVATIDLASGGFASLIPTRLTVGTGAGFTLYLPASAGGGTAPISGRCTVASVRSQGNTFRVSFKFDKLVPEAQEQLEIALIDAVLERFVTKF